MIEGSRTIWNIVRAPGRPPSRAYFLAALASTALLHGILVFGLFAAPKREPIPRHDPISPMHVIEVEAPVPSEPEVEQIAEPQEAPAPPKARLPPQTNEAPPQQPKEEPAPSSEIVAPPTVAPSAAGAALVAEPELVDFTDFEITTGSADSFGGGESSDAGTNTVAARGEAVVRGGEVGSARGGGPTLAHGVRLAAESWDCPWPSDARALHDREREVRIRVVVRADGSPASVDVISDPGHGFAEAARSCALGMKYTAAIGSSGQPVEARSPLIRVLFKR